MAFDLSTQLVASMSRVEGPFHAFLTLTLESTTTQFFTPKSMTMVSAVAIRGKYRPDRGIQWHLG
jgi:hypothetical protein